MRIGIIAAPIPSEEAPAPPLGLTYVAAAFEQREPKCGSSIIS